MQARVVEVDNEPLGLTPVASQARTVQVDNEPLGLIPLASQARRLELTDAARKPTHKARDPTNLADPMLYAIARAERAQSKSLATAEQTLAEMVLRMRLVDAGKR